MHTPIKSPLRPLGILAAVAGAAILSGCAVPAQQRYAQPVNPYEWHTVSVTPVAPGSRVIARETRPTEYTMEEYRPAPARVEYTTEPVYQSYPAYTPAPVYAPPPAYYYPPVTIGLDFVFGNWGHRHHHRGRRR